MAVNWNLYTKRLNLNGSSVRERQINLLKDSVSKDFQDIPSWRSAYFNNDTTPKDIQVIDDKEDFIKEILMFPETTINTGDLIEFDNEKWLCKSVDKTNPVEEKGTVYLCNNTLTLYKNQTYTQIPCVVESSVQLYRMGANENQTISTPNTTTVVRIPNNEITSLIQRDDIFKIGAENFKVIDKSDIVEKGLIILKMEFSETEQIFPTFSLSITSGTSANIGLAHTLQLHTDLYDGISQYPLSPTPLIEYVSSNSSIATVDENGLVTPVSSGTVQITASINSLGINVSDTFAVNISAGYYDIMNLTFDIVGVDEIKQGQTQTYVVKKYNDGAEMTGNFDIVIDAGDTPDDAYNFNVIDTKSFSIKCNKYPYYNDVTATDRVSNIPVTKRIKLRGVI